jgi:GNAT superfamily N-acetyltransferase
VSGDDLTIRPMQDADLDAVVDLLTRSLGPAPGGADRRALFVWKHLENHFGRSLALVAEAEGQLVGLRAFMRWAFEGPDGTYSAVRAVDTATDPAAQRRGIFSRLTTAALERCWQEGVDLVFNTPNEKSLPGYLKMGWTRVTRWPVWLRVRRPLALAGAAVRRDLSAGGPVGIPESGALRSASEVLDGDGLAEVVQRAARPEARLATARTVDYLRWRYGRAPIPYHVWTGEGAAVILRVRSRGRLAEAVVDEVLAPPGDVRTARRALSAAIRASGSTHAAAHFGQGWPARRGLRRAGFLRPPRAGMTFTVRPVSDRPGPAGGLTDAAAWSLTLGDLELF